MCDALKKTAEVLVGWCDTHQSCYPPTVIHVTDGQSTDGDAEPIADALKHVRFRFEHQINLPRNGNLTGGIVGSYFGDPDALHAAFLIASTLE